MKNMSQFLVLGILAISNSSFAQSNGNASKYPTLVKLCSAQMTKNSNRELSLGTLVISAQEVVYLSLACDNNFLDLHLNRTIVSGRSVYTQQVKPVSYKVLKGIENGHQSLDVIVSSDEDITNFVQHLELNLGANGQPIYGNNMFSGTVDGSKTSGVYMSESKESMAVTCILGSNNIDGCDAVAARQVAFPFGERSFGPAVSLSNTALKSPTNSDPVAAISRVDFQASVAELAALADESSVVKLSENEAQKIVDTAKKNIAASNN